MCAQALCADRFKCVYDNADEQYRQLVLTINGAYVTGRSVQAGWCSLPWPGIEKPPCCSPLVSNSTTRLPCSGDAWAAYRWRQFGCQAKQGCSPCTPSPTLCRAQLSRVQMRTVAPIPADKLNVGYS